MPGEGLVRFDEDAEERDGEKGRLDNGEIGRFIKGRFLFKAGRSGGESQTLLALPQCYWSLSGTGLPEMHQFRLGPNHLWSESHKLKFTSVSPRPTRLSPYCKLNVCKIKQAKRKHPEDIFNLRVLQGVLIVLAMG